MTGKDLIEFITKHQLEDAEWDDDYFVVVLSDGSWLQYDPEEDYVRHFPDPDTEDDDWYAQTLSLEEAKELREDLA